MEFSIKHFKRYGVLENDILLNLSTIMLMNRYEIQWQHSMSLAKSIIIHCVMENFDSHGRQMMMLNSFYILFTLSFDNYAGIVLPSLLFGREQETTEANNPEFILSFFREQWLDIYFSRKFVDGPLLLDLSICMCSSLLMFVENISRDTPYDRKSKAVALILERMAIEVRDSSFNIITMVFEKVMSYLHRNCHKLLH